jgi:hypothetical protein
MSEAVSGAAAAVFDMPGGRMTRADSDRIDPVPCR